MIVNQQAQRPLGLYLGIAAGLTFFLYQGSDYRRKKILINKFFKADKDKLYKLNKSESSLKNLDRSDYLEKLSEMVKSDKFQNFLIDPEINVMYGVSGCGKTQLAQELVQYLQEQKKQPAMYFSCRSISSEKGDYLKQISKQIGYLPKKWLNSNQQYQSLFDNLEAAVIEINRKYQLEPVIIIDDIQSLFNNDIGCKTVKTVILNSLVYGMNESRQAKFILLSSDRESISQYSYMSGMSRRINYLDFEQIQQEQFEQYLQNNFEKIKSKNPKINDIKILKQFQEDCGEDICYLKQFIYDYDGDYRQTIKRELYYSNMILRIQEMLKWSGFQEKILQKIREKGEFRVYDIPNYEESYNEIKKNIQELESKNIIHINYKYGSDGEFHYYYYQFCTPKLKFAYDMAKNGLDNIKK